MYRLNITLIAVLLATASEARIINVPQNQRTINGAIENSEDGDTVLVARGTYREDVNFEGKAITLAGNFLFTHNPEDIDSTIIQGQSSVVRFDSGESETSILMGFSLTGGQGSADVDGSAGGGGIHCRRSSPTLSHLKIRGCRANFGAGIFVQYSSPTISDVEIFDNFSGQSGGGIYCSREGANPVITRALVYRNRTGTWGEAFGCYTDTHPTLINCTFAGYPYEDRIGDADGLISSYGNNYITLINCVLYATTMGNIGWDRDDDTLEATYTCFSAGQEGFDPNNGVYIFGDGVIEEDPMFSNFAEGDFTPSWANYPAEDETKSPLIDAGDPESPDDADGSRADMGALQFVRGGWLLGTVTRANNGAPIAGASIAEGLRQILVTDLGGYFESPNHPAGRIDLHVFATGFLDTMLIGLELAQAETLDLDIRLLNADFFFADDTLRRSLMTGDWGDISFDVENRGNGSLSYDAVALPTAMAGLLPGTLLESVSYLEDLPFLRVEAGAFVGGRYYLPVSGFGGIEDKQICVLHREGGIIEFFRQPTFENHYGIRSLAWDGGKFWGTPGNDTIYAFNTEGDSVTSIAFPARTIGSNYYLSWDSVRSLLWITRGIGDFYAIDTERREIVDTLAIPGMRKYGISWANEPEGASIYILEYVGGRGPNLIKKINTVTEQLTEVAELDSAGRNGLFITTNYDAYHSSVAMTNNRELDEIEMLHISPNGDWAFVEPAEGTIPAGESANFTLFLDASDLIPEIYPGEIHFDHNGLGLESIIPFVLQVIPFAVSDYDRDMLSPGTLCLNPLHPNPFNSSVIIAFSVGQVSEPVKLAVYDISGRLVADLSHSAFRTPHSASGRIIWEAGDIPAGIYLVRLEAEGLAVTRKAVLMK